jgi:hypothetical protein
MLGISRLNICYCIASSSLLKLKTSPSQTSPSQTATSRTPAWVHSKNGINHFFYLRRQIFLGYGRNCWSHYISIFPAKIFWVLSRFRELREAVVQRNFLCDVDLKKCTIISSYLLYASLSIILWFKYFYISRKDFKIGIYFVMPSCVFTCTSPKAWPKSPQRRATRNLQGFVFKNILIVVFFYFSINWIASKHACLHTANIQYDYFVCILHFHVTHPHAQVRITKPQQNEMQRSWFQQKF